MSYTSQALIEAKLKRSLTAAEIASLAVLLPAIDAYINKMTGTTFTNAGAIETVFIDTPREQVNGRSRFRGYYRDDATVSALAKLVIPTMNGITKVEVATGFKGVLNVLPSAQYELYPRGKSYTYALVIDDNWSSVADVVCVTGYLGYGVVPGDIQMVATEMASSDVVARTDGVLQEKVDQWWQTYSPMSSSGAVGSITAAGMAVLAGYKRLSMDI